MQLNDNLIVRMLAVVIAIAIGLRIIVWLLMPVMPYLVGLVAAFTVCKLVGWYRGRW